MPITASAQGKTFTFPDGTSPEQMGLAIDEFFAGEQVAPEVQATAQQPEPTGFPGASVIEPLGVVGSSIIAEPLAGIAGIAQTLNPFADPGAGAAAVKATKEALTFKPRTEKGQAGLQAVGEALKPVGEAIKGAEQTLGDVGFEAAGPVGGAIGATIPTAIGEALGLFAGRAISKLGQVKTAKAQEAIKALDDAERGVVTDKGLADVADVIQKGDAEDIATIIDADAEFYRAADELGITTEPLAGFASQNPQFRDVEAALRKVPGSALDAQAIGFIKETSQRADDLIEQYGGTLDKGQLGLDFKESSLTVVDDLFQQADDAYGKLGELIPKSSTFQAPNTVDFLSQLKADGQLSGKLGGVLNQLEDSPKLGTIDLIRREVGQAIGKGSGRFKDVETGQNKALYARLTKDQDGIASSVGGDALAISDTGKSLVKQRKQLEDNLQTLLGKDLNKALSVTVSGALKKLSVGEIDKFNEVMSAIPKQQRGQVLLSSMNDVFKGTGVGQSQLSPTGFTKWYDTIKRSPAARKALFGNLPPDSKKAIDNLYEVSRGISRSLQQTTPTGRINALFNPETGFIRKMIGSAAARGIAISTGSPVAGAMANSTVEFLKQASNPAKRASELMSSPQFQNLIRQSVKEGVIDGNAKSAALVKAEANIAKSAKFKKWADTLGVDDRAALQGGIVTYLFKDLSEENR